MYYEVFFNPFFANERYVLLVFSNGDSTNVFALATREDDTLFSSFVNCVVLAIIYSQEMINRMSVFGTKFSWALRDAISYIGSYDRIYVSNFADVSKESRGRNDLNEQGGPQILPFPGLSL